MIKLNHIRFWATLLVMGWGSMLHASGFQIAEMGTRAMAMSNAFTAVADDPSAQWYNPAAAVFLPGKQLMIGSPLIYVPSSDFTTNTLNPAHPDSTSSASKTLAVPHLYASHNLEGQPMTLGLGINAPFGLETDWPANGPFAISNTFSQLNMTNINPNLAIQANENLAIAGGVNYVKLFKVHLNNSAQLLTGHGDGWGGNLALLYKKNQYRVGLTYRSRVTIDIENGTVTGGPALATLGAPGAVGQTGKVSTRVVLPDQVNLGLAWQAKEDWLLSLDIDWTNWDTFDNLDFHYQPSVVATTITGGTNFRTLPENWSSGTAIRLGADWSYSNRLDLMAGYSYDPTPVDDVHFSPSIPDRDRQLFSLGGDFHVNSNWDVQAAYMFVLFKDRRQTASTGNDAVRNGTYSGDVHLFSVSLVYRL